MTHARPHASDLMPMYMLGLMVDGVLQYATVKHGGESQAEFEVGMAFPTRREAEEFRVVWAAMNDAPPDDVVVIECQPQSVT